MVNRNLIREFNVSDEELQEVFGTELDLSDPETSLDSVYDTSSETYELNTIIDGVVLRQEGDDVLIDIGYKSEGIVPLEEFREAEGLQVPEAGATVQVLL
ncbi:MAG: 30S ribosomal protein S1, partial [Planctomycetaceae bacterium]